MSCRLEFTDTAKQDLREIAFYIAEQSKEKTVAIRFVTELQDKCKILENFPESGAIPKDRMMKSAGHRFVVHGDYLIFYKYEASEKVAYILAVFNAKRDYMKIMRKFI